MVVFPVCRHDRHAREIPAAGEVVVENGLQQEPAEILTLETPSVADEDAGNDRSLHRETHRGDAGPPEVSSQRIIGRRWDVEDRSRAENQTAEERFLG